ncbi:Phosphopantothenoylcysteine decarboxylase [Linum perenne]
MNTFMWNNPFTERHLVSIDEIRISLIPPINGAMAEPFTINQTVRMFLEARKQQHEDDGRIN